MCEIGLLGFSRSGILNLVSDLQLEATLVHGKQTEIFSILCQSSLYFSSHHFDSRTSVAKVFLFFEVKDFESPSDLLSEATQACGKRSEILLTLC